MFLWTTFVFVFKIYTNSGAYITSKVVKYVDFIKINKL